MEKMWLGLRGAVASADPDREREYDDDRDEQDKSYASKMQRPGDDIQDRDRREDQSQQVCM